MEIRNEMIGEVTKTLASFVAESTNISPIDACKDQILSFKGYWTRQLEFDQMNKMETKNDTKKNSMVAL